MNSCMTVSVKAVQTSDIAEDVVLGASLYLAATASWLPPMLKLKLKKGRLLSDTSC